VPERLFAQNERDLSATLDARMKLVATPGGKSWRFALYDRANDRAETRDVSATQADVLRTFRRELELFWDSGEHEMAAIRSRLATGTPIPCMDVEACENMKSLGYGPADTVCKPCR
jgi:hypothetical protein